MHLTRNPSSGKVMQKTGMKHEGTRKEHIIKWEQFEDIEEYDEDEILEEEENDYEDDDEDEEEILHLDESYQ